LTISTIASGAVCPDDTEKHHFGVKVAPSAGVNLNVEASEAGDENEPFLSKAIAVCISPVLPVKVANHQNKY
jgi:hypothetical protein